MDIKNKTKIDQYLQWPLISMLFFIPADIFLFFLNLQCGLILAIFIVFGIAFQMVGYH